LVQSKENDQWGDGYFHIWLKTNFPQLRFGKKLKRSRFLQLVCDLGLVVRVQKGNTSHGPSIWKLGTTSTPVSVHKPVMAPIEEYLSYWE
jgi:hypothetical protein